MSLSPRLLTAGAMLTALFFAAAAPTACGSSDAPGTSGARIAPTVKVVGSPAARTAFTNSQGWTVTLSKALVATGALYYYEGATIFSMVTPAARSPFDRLWEAVGERTAFAHPGHYVPGNAKGEYLAPSSVDLLTGSVLGVGNGVTGIVRSATFSFQSPAAGPFAAELGTHVVVLEGSATKAADTRPFRAEIDAADLTNTKGSPSVEGCPFVETDMQRDGVVTVTLEIARWFDQVEFDSLPPSADGAAVVLPTTAIGRNELVRGMKEGLGYSFAYVPN